MTDSEKLDLILGDIRGMKADMQGMKDEMQDMKADIRGMKADIQGMKDEMQDMKADIQGMKDEMQDMKADIQGVKQELSDVRQKVTRMDLTIENELRVNIQRVAEGHLDLSRILHEAMQPCKETETLSIKVRMLESDVRDLKARFA